LDKESIVIAREEAEASKALEEAIPALEAAKRALENINKAALDELKAFAQPAPVIIDVCAACFFLQPKTTGQPDWSGIKMQVLGNFKLVDELKTYDVEHTKTAGANNAKKKMQKI
jgi:dynein heavy chain